MAHEHATDAAALAALLGAYRRWFVLTGAGCSTDSGIPAYRDENGVWQHKAPIQYADFRSKDAVRRRYWARSFVGFERMRRARPNAAHGALAELEMAGRVEVLATQNVDGLHQLAGSQRVIDLHGQLARVACLGCRAETSRERLQAELEAQNPFLAHARELGPAPDGDAEVGAAQGNMLRVPVCSECGGVLKPAVVFFGETVPRERVARAYAALEASDAVLVVGSSLSVFSGYRFVRRAHEQGKPIIVVNRGVTRADAMAKLKISGSCGPLLSAAVGLSVRSSG
ncbi:MAG TPA: NAD-dependent protein deacetylase, partial [Polyangiaceae bacterium]|nr:NAD-dependent protein deacetylase [Polyangiaceae bacterium]